LQNLRRFGKYKTMVLPRHQFGRAVQENNLVQMISEAHAEKDSHF
jgi:hypothetical protein